MYVCFGKLYFSISFIMNMHVCFFPFFDFEGGMWDLIVLVPGHCLSLNFITNYQGKISSFFHPFMLLSLICV